MTDISFTLFLAHLPGARRRDLGLKAQVTRPRALRSATFRTQELGVHPVPLELLRRLRSPALEVHSRELQLRSWRCYVPAGVRSW